MSDLGNWGQYGRLTMKAPYGSHIGLRCKMHPDAIYHTKNIAPIGARTIFHSSGPDCPCGCENLEVIPTDGPDIPETPRI